MKPLERRVAVVAGASRGCGRGIALALGNAGATVIVTGRSTRSGPKPPDNAPGTIEDTAEEVSKRGGQGIALCVDHTDADQVEQLFRNVHSEAGPIDIVACTVWGGNERYMDPVWREPFWKQPSRGWDEAMHAGPYAFWLTARAAAGLMAGQGTGLIAAISEPLTDQFEDQQTPLASSLAHLAHYSVNRLVRDMGRDARGHGFAVVGVLPGFMRTERVEMHLADEAARRLYRYDLSESPEYCGRAIAALAAHHVWALQRSGELLFVSDLADEFGFTDTDGKRVGNFYKAVLGA